jgi:hypothetical protein
VGTIYEGINDECQKADIKKEKETAQREIESKNIFR